MRRRQALNLKVPFVLNNPYRIGLPRPISVAALEVNGGYFCVEYQLGIEQVTLFSCDREQIGSRYYLVDEPVAAHIAELKRKALKHGATLEAIQLLKGITPITKEEEAIMAATKLKTKGDAEALKTAAKAAPVGGKKVAPEATPAKRKGNPEALAKARAAKGPKAPDTRKLAIAAEHAKGNPYREGTKAAATFDLMKKHKTVASFLDAAGEEHDTAYLRYASRDGYITLT